MTTYNEVKQQIHRNMNFFIGFLATAAIAIGADIYIAIGVLNGYDVTDLGLTVIVGGSIVAALALVGVYIVARPEPKVSDPETIENVSDTRTIEPVVETQRPEALAEALAPPTPPQV